VNFGQLVTEYQAHGGSVNTSTTPSVQYGFADGSANTIRPTALVYPNGRELTYDYGTADGLSDRCSRIASIIDDDDTHLADYSHLGRQTFVAQDDTEPQMKWTLIDLTGSNDPDTGDIYSGFDRFGRVKDNRWYNYDALADVDRIQYGYDRAGNRIWRKNVVAASLSKEFDELYAYDGVQRLQDMARGTLNSGKTALTSETFAQCWTLDATGNWTGFREDDNGDGTWDLVQTRTASEVNEITNLSESTGPSWITPAYNRAGNMTTMPKVADPTTAQTCTYDAWNRLVKVAEGSDTVSEYAYDGAKRRILQKTYTGGSLTDTRHLYYTEPSIWQVLEERVGSSTDAERQFVWGLRYIDDLVLRDRETERLYAMQDANWNVTGITDGLGAVQERYAYAAYGSPVFLSDVFVPQTAAFDWESLYCGYRYEVGSGLFQVRNRVYHPVLGVWIQRDPLGSAPDVNYVRYCNSQPIYNTDSEGLRIFTVEECRERNRICRQAASERFQACFKNARTDEEDLDCGRRYATDLDICQGALYRCLDDAIDREPEFRYCPRPVPLTWFELIALIGLAAAVALVQSGQRVIQVGGSVFILIWIPPSCNYPGDPGCAA